jgi:hypothetical protein
MPDRERNQLVLTDWKGIERRDTAGIDVSGRANITIPLPNAYSPGRHVIRWSISDSHHDFESAELLRGETVIDP